MNSPGRSPRTEYSPPAPVTADHGEVGIGAGSSRSGSLPTRASVTVTPAAGAPSDVDTLPDTAPPAESTTVRNENRIRSGHRH